MLRLFSSIGEERKRVYLNGIVRHQLHPGGHQAGFIFTTVTQMKRLQLLRWSGTVLSLRTRPFLRIPTQWHTLPYTRQFQSSASAISQEEASHDADEFQTDIPPAPSPPVQAALSSARLSSLHSRLSLPDRLPLQTLARTLVHSSADLYPQFNNSSFAVLGGDLMNYYTSEYLICTYPRLPMSVLWAAIYAYIGPKALCSMSREWGVEYAAEPGSEVDPGFLQFKRLPPDTPIEQILAGTKRQSSSIVKGNVFGDKPQFLTDFSNGVPPEQACASFVQALVGAIYIHVGRPAAKNFYRDHFLSRQLSVADLFSFSQPARDLKKLCAREGFEPPVARILSETGRVSRHPVFTVGVFSGEDKLGEGSGASLPEARFRAAAAALKGWYLYSPLAVRVPSSMEESGAEPWTPALVDPGEIIV